MIRRFPLNHRFNLDGCLEGRQDERFTTEDTEITE